MVIDTKASKFCTYRLYQTFFSTVLSILMIKRFHISQYKFDSIDIASMRHAVLSSALSTDSIKSSQYITRTF